jgi:hypothetical protein
MALEQIARGLNARLCAIERSYAPERLPSPQNDSRPADGPVHTEIAVADGDDFVPAAGACIIYGQQEEAVSSHEVQNTPDPAREGEKPHARRSLSLDIAGLAAGVILILVSALLYTGNTEILKNPALPFIFGVLVIICVCVGRHYG